MSDLNSTIDSASPATHPAAKTHRKWFPAVVLAAFALFWAWVRQSEYTDDFKNVFFGAGVIATSIAISVWFLRNAGVRRRTRRWIVATPWLLVAILLLIFRPVFSGDLDIVGWRLRFGAADDEALKLVAPNQEAVEWQATPHDFPRFLGNGPWAAVERVELDTDWTGSPPQEVWRRKIGAGWSSFAVVGNHAITQEQRGPNELVTCYRVDDGELMWVHVDPVRFDPVGPNASFAGPGPRATPTIVRDKVVTQGATGIVNCLDARTGKMLWSHDTVAEHGVDLPQWGKSNSPLVVDDMVIISVGAPSDPEARETAETSLVAYDLDSGDVRWAAGNRRASYASPIFTTIAGEPQIISVNEKFVTAHRASDGHVLWEHPWADENDSSESASQPVPIAGDRLFLSKGYGVGASLLKVVRESQDEFTVRPLWEPAIKPVMKTKMGNIVVHDGYVYGLDGVLLQCIELKTGKVEWKKRRRPSFGHGQLLLVSDMILVLTEGGELLAVEASPKRYQELAAIQVLDEANVTWNNPAFAPPYLLVRNGHEAACYRMPLQ